MDAAKITTKITNTIKKIDFSETEGQNIDQGERLVSLLGGGYLLYKSLKNLPSHPLVGIQGALASGFLVYRGITGICPLYKALDKDTTDPEAITIVEQITVNAPRESL